MSLAKQAETDGDRHRYEQLVDDLDNQIRLSRTYPFSIWLAGMLVVIALLPWALLARAGHGGLGVAVSAIVVVCEVAMFGLRRRHGRA